MYDSSLGNAVSIVFNGRGSFYWIALCGQIKKKKQTKDCVASPANTTVEVYLW